MKQPLESLEQGAMPGKLHMRNFLISLLQDNLPEFYYYHNLGHTLYVLEQAIEIGVHEKCNQEEIALLTAAAYWHDSGYIKTYADHEEESCKLARHYLPEYGYSSIDIDTVCGIIMATKIPQSPTNKLEEILADADLEYLGTNDVEIKAGNLFRELQSLDPSITEGMWKQIQISFLQKHHYFTRFCIENREPVKQEYLNKLAQSAQ